MPEGHALTHLPPHGFAHNQLCCALAALACELVAWLHPLALSEHSARRWQPKRLRPRLFTVPATLAHSGRRRLLHLADHAWASAVTDAFTRRPDLTAGPAPAPG